MNELGTEQVLRLKQISSQVFPGNDSCNYFVFEPSCQKQAICSISIFMRTIPSMNPRAWKNLFWDVCGGLVQISSRSSDTSECQKNWRSKGG